MLTFDSPLLPYCDPHPKLLPAVNVQQSVTGALFSPSTPTSQHTQPSALCFQNFQ